MAGRWSLSLLLVALLLLFSAPLVVNATENIRTSSINHAADADAGGDTNSFRRELQQEESLAVVTVPPPATVQENDEVYIVIYKDQPPAGADASVDATTASIKSQVESTVVPSLGGTVIRSYRHVINAFAAKLSAGAVQELAQDVNIAFIEKDVQVSVAGAQRENVPWNLDRIDQRQGTDGMYVYSATGAGVHAYILDTGITSVHMEFRNRLGTGYNAIQGNEQQPQPWDDCHRHGSIVASIVGGTNYGVAKRVILHAVRVIHCDGIGFTSDVIEGMDWVVAQHNANPGQKSVANLSFATQGSTALNTVVSQFAAAGIVVAVAAGNGNENACTWTPAGAGSGPNVLTVGATDKTDARAGYSNYGPCVTLYAPGDQILGAGFGCTTCTATGSGTSLAAPHVVGVAALYYQQFGGNATFIRNTILANALNGIISNSNTDSTKFLHTVQCKPKGSLCILGQGCCSGFTCGRRFLGRCKPI